MQLANFRDYGFTRVFFFTVVYLFIINDITLQL